MSFGESGGLKANASLFLFHILDGERKEVNLYPPKISVMTNQDLARTYPFPLSAHSAISLHLSGTPAPSNVARSAFTPALRNHATSFIDTLSAFLAGIGIGYKQSYPTRSGP